MTDKHKEFEEWALSDEGAYHESELRKSSQGKYALPATRIASESWQACQQLKDKRIQQLLAVIEKKDEAINQAIKDMAVSVGIMMLNGGMPTEDQNNKLIAISKPDSDIGKLKQSLALAADDVELVEVNHVDFVEVDPAHYDVVSTLDDSEKLYKIQMKGK